MKAKRFKIKIQSTKEFFDDFKKNWKLVSSGKAGNPTDDEVVLGFSNLSMVAKVLSSERLRLIQMVREKKPSSVNELAILLERSQTNVHKDVHYLADLGILDLKRVKIRGGKAEAVQPRCKWSGFDIDLAS
jgi:predicted transcriptional regulator